MVTSPNVSATPSLLHGVRKTTKLVAGRDAAQDPSLLEECVKLFNEHYGMWGPLGPHPGRPVRISTVHLAQLLDHDDASLSTIRVDDELAGYTVVVRCEMGDLGRIHWVSQLVVAQHFRKLRFATDLLFSAWNFSGAYGWGLATANPYAVRALETTTRRHCSRRLIVERGDELCALLRDSIPYVATHLARDAEGKILTTIDTMFYLDHTDVQAMKENAARKDRRWELGKELPEGHEWFAVVFGDQEPVDVEGDRLSHLLSASDESWISAYARMDLGEAHAWMRHTEQEAEFLFKLVEEPAMFVDVGCGVGRHAEAINSVGVATEVRAFDIVPELIERARRENPDSSVKYAVADLRNERGDEAADLTYALYDVLGSSTNPGDDERLLSGIASFTKPGGLIVLSVMNAVPMLENTSLTRVETEAELVKSLERLPSSNVMESTGNVFDASLCVEFDGIFFRKEAFVAPGDALPAEIVVRDKRYTPDSIARLVQDCGLVLRGVVPVQAGEWNRQPPLAPSDSRAKELLVIVEKPRA